MCVSGKVKVCVIKYHTRLHVKSRPVDVLKSYLLLLNADVHSIRVLLEEAVVCRVGLSVAHQIFCQMFLVVQGDGPRCFLVTRGYLLETSQGSALNLSFTIRPSLDSLVGILICLQEAFLSSSPAVSLKPKRRVQLQVYD